MFRLSIFAALVLTCALAFTLVGCQSIAEKATEAAIEDATGVKVDQEGDSVTITGEDGSSITAGQGGELPEGFPEDAPVYDGDITTSLVTEDSFTIGIETDDEWTKVWDWYTAELESEGWTTTSELKVEDSGMLSGEKDDRLIQITVGPNSNEDAKTMITTFTGPKS